MDVSQRVHAHVRGPWTARVTLREFADFECPYCAEAYDVVRRLEAAYGDRIRFTFFQFPLRRVHPHAEAAAEAAEAAGAQGRFWEMYEVLFEHHDALERADLVRYAAAIGLDVDRFERELTSGLYAPAIDRSIAFGESIGVGGTPAFFINDEPIEDAAYPALAALIDERLSA